MISFNHSHLISRFSCNTNIHLHNISEVASPCAICFFVTLSHHVTIPCDTDKRLPSLTSFSCDLIVSPNSRADAHNSV